MKNIFRSRNFLIGAGFAVALGALAVGQFVIARKALAQGNMAPKFEVNPFWPKPLPNHWIMGTAIGVWVDNNDHIWMVHRSCQRRPYGKPLERGLGECCQAAPPVLEFDEAGNLLRHWGGPGEGYEWPDSNHGIFIDYKGQCLDRRQWRSGLADPEIHQGRQVPDAGRQEGRAPQGRRGAGPTWKVRSSGICRRQQRSRQFRPRREDLRRCQGKRGLCRRRLPEQARRGARCRYRQDEALVGRLWQQAGRHAARPLRSGRAAAAAIPQSRCTAPTCRSTG